MRFDDLFEMTQSFGKLRAVQQIIPYFWSGSKNRFYFLLLQCILRHLKHIWELLHSNVM